MHLKFVNITFESEGEAIDAEWPLIGNKANFVQDCWSNLKHTLTQNTKMNANRKI